MSKSITEFLDNKYSGKSISELFIELKDIKDLSPNERDKKIANLGMIAELDASNFYETMAELATHPELKEVLLDVAREEKVHFGEFEAMIEMLDNDFEDAEEEGEEEVGHEEEDDDDEPSEINFDDV